MSLKRKFFLLGFTIVFSLFLTTFFTIQPAWAWSGVMDVRVCNRFPSDFKGKIWHKWTELEGAWDVVIDDSVLKSGECLEPGSVLQVGEGGRDVWAFDLENDFGDQIKIDEKQCNIEEKDFNSGKVVIINISGPSELTIKPPVSTSCQSGWGGQVDPAHYQK